MPVKSRVVNLACTRIETRDRMTSLCWYCMHSCTLTALLSGVVAGRSLELVRQPGDQGL